MKKFLLTIVSFAMLMAGCLSFTSCGDDDDEENNSLTASELFAKYADGKSGIEGDDVVYRLDDILMIYTFDGNKIVGQKMIQDMKTNDAAIEATSSESVQEMIEENNATLTVDGQYLVYTCNDLSEVAGYQGLTKEQFLSALSILNSYTEDSLDF